MASLPQAVSLNPFAELHAPKAIVALYYLGLLGTVVGSLGLAGSGLYTLTFTGTYPFAFPLAIFQIVTAGGALVTGLISVRVASEFAFLLFKIVSSHADAK
ncbi:hypothetical protein AGMMS50229_12700 [Campylobacterota bacterium]|nr:hypothetical protein AGMMS50229_12700 [Campylobacterota bacterium]